MKNLLEEGIDLFNSGDWYDAHEVWEDLWRDSEGEERLFAQGLVQIAVGLHHLSRGNTRGGSRVLERGMKKLAQYPAHYRGIDNGRLQHDLHDAVSQSPFPPVSIHRIRADQ